MRTVLLTIFIIVFLQGCGKGRALGNDPSEPKSTKEACTRVANKYIADNYLGLDPLWRDQERYQQYRICMAKAKQN